MIQTRIYAYRLVDNINSEKLRIFLCKINNKLSFTFPKKFLNLERTSKSMLGEILARYSIVLNTDLSNSDISFRKNSFGKASIVDIRDVHFNISHSGDWLICGISSQQIGVDLELKKTMDYRNIMEIFFSVQEQSYVLNTSNIQDAFFEIWTLKESYLKSLGVGLSKKLSDFSILKKKNNTYALSDSNHNNTNISFANFNFHFEYKLAVCVAGENSLDKVDIEYVMLNDLMSTI